jgi:hypothetical protein
MVLEINKRKFQKGFFESKRINSRGSNCGVENSKKMPEESSGKNIK